MPRRPHPVKRRRWIGVVGALLVLALIVADQRGWLLVEAGDDLSYFHGRQARVVHIVDGDTLDIDLPDPTAGTARTRVRLWGIDAPEVGGPGRNRQPFADDAAQFVREAVQGRVVTLHVERSRVRDRYDRLLAHVELPDGGMLNHAILLAGYARADDRWPHTRMTHYAQAERTAQRTEEGIWGDDADEGADDQ